MAARIYRPRMAAVLTVPIAGTAAERTNQEASSETIDLPIRPSRLHLVSNGHQDADTCSVTADWREAGVDPRMLDDAVIQVHVANADDFGNWTPSRENCRFVGILKENAATREVGKAGQVTLDAVDYTDVFLRAKPFGSEGIPKLTQTLPEAWRTVVSQTPGAEALADRLVFEGDAEGVAAAGLASTPIGQAVAERFRKIGKVQTEPETDAWAVWQQCVGMLGLISFIRLDQCVVTTATNYYTEKDSPILIWGRNLVSWTERRNANDFASTGIALTSFDAIKQRTIEAYYPPIGDTRVKRKKSSAKKVGGSGGVLQREKRDYFPFPGITDPDALAQIAQMIWEQRSRQELSGTCATAEMSVARLSGSDFDMLELTAGDSVEVHVEPENQQLLAALEPGARVPFLVRRGYTEEVATLLVKNMEEFAELGSKFHVHKVETELELEEDGGSFRVTVDYLNRMTITGAATL